MTEAVAALPSDAEAVADEEETAGAELTETASLEREQPEFSPLMHSLHLDSPLLFANTAIYAQPSPIEATAAAANVQDEMYNHHALLALQDTLQQTSRPPSAASTAHTSGAAHLPPNADAPFTVAPATVASAGNRYSAAHQKRLDAYYLRLQAYHLQRALANEEKQQLDDRRDRILEQHTLTRLKQAMRQQHKRTTTMKQSQPQLDTPLAHNDPLELSLARQAQVAALREARLANKHRIQQMYADVAALRKENEEMAEETLRRARLAAEDAASDRQARIRQQRAERQRRAHHIAEEREASAHFVTIANSVAQQVGQLERKEWREHRAGDTKQAVQHRKLQTEQHREQVQAVKTENYHRRQLNALLQQQTAQALLAQRQNATQQRQQQHRIAQLPTTLTQQADKHPTLLELPPSAHPSPPPLLHSLSVSSQAGTVSLSPVSTTPILPFMNASMESSTTASPLLAAQPAGDGCAPATSPLAPLLFLLESKAKQATEQRAESKQ